MRNLGRLTGALLLLALPAAAQWTYVDNEPGDVARRAETAEGAAGLNQVLSGGFDSGDKFVQVPRTTLPPDVRAALPASDSIEGLMTEMQSNTDWSDTDGSKIPYALGRVKDQGDDHIDYGDLEARKAGEFRTDKDHGTPERRVLINKKLKALAQHGVGRWALASVLVHEGKHAEQDELGDKRESIEDGVKSEVEAFTAQYKYLKRHSDQLYAGAQDSLVTGDPLVMKFYKHLIDIVEYGDGGRLENLVRKNYRTEDLH